MTEIEIQHPRLNEDVPDSTILQYVRRENRQLRQENEELKARVKQQDIAIHDFKQWQAKVAEYNWRYWVQKGCELMENPPGEAERKALVAVLDRVNPFAEQIAKAKQTLKKFRTEIKQLAKMEAALDEEPSNGEVKISLE
jgi:regulator of replication initiation timing